MIEISKCLRYINDFKLYSKWTGEINKAIAYWKLKNRSPMMWLYKRPFLPQDFLQRPQQPTGAIGSANWFYCQVNFRCLILRPHLKSVHVGGRWWHRDWEWPETSWRRCLGMHTGEHLSRVDQELHIRRLWGWNRQLQTGSQRFTSYEPLACWPQLLLLHTMERVVSSAPCQHMGKISGNEIS